MVLNIPGLVSVLVFYLTIFIIGVLAGRKKPSDLDSKLLADRNLGLFICTCTATASIVGGAYILGTAEAVGRDGLIWIVAPVCYNLSALFTTFIVVPKIREGCYTTMFDPLQNKFGKKMGAVLFINELMANLLWEAAILGSLGSSLASIIEVDFEISVIASTCVAMTYTFFGGLYSVSYTDVIQVCFITVGLILVTPFVFTNDAVDLERVGSNWIGSLPTNWIGYYIDIIFLCIGGGVPWAQIYQGVLASKSQGVAVRALLISMVLCLALLIPPSLIGIAGSATDWNKTSYPGNTTLQYEEWASVFPLALRYLCPSVVSILGLGAISAAVMSSVDSIVLSTGGVLTRNIYITLFRPTASKKEIVWALRISIFTFGSMGMIIAIKIRSVYALYVLSGELMFVAQFPQLMCALWLKCGNTYGSLSGYLIGIFMRISGGEPSLKIPSIIKYPFYDESTNLQLFPFRTLSMICSLIGIVGISHATEYLFQHNVISKKFDIFNCFLKEACEFELTEGMPCTMGEKNSSKRTERTDGERSNILEEIA